MTPAGPTGPEAARQVAWAWVDHLRAGGTTPWRDFRSGHRTDLVPDQAPDQAPDRADVSRGRLPGAAQLELARLLAERAANQTYPDPDARGALIDRALERSGPGRGLLELPLDLAGDLTGDLAGDLTGKPTDRVGAPATDPADVPAEELVRVGVGLLVVELLRAGAQAGSNRNRRRRRRPFSGSFLLGGAPTTTAAVRAALADAGHLGGGRSPEVLLLAPPLEQMLGQVWSARVQRGAPVSWTDFVGRWSRQVALPPSADLSALARSWAERVGAGRVHVVADPDPLRTAADLLGIRLRAAGRASTPDLVPLPGAAVDLLRRVNQVLAVRVPEDQQAAFRRVVSASWASGSRGMPADADEPGIVVPSRHRHWVEEQSARLVKELRRGGYPVHGDLDRITARQLGPQRPRRREVLDLVLDVVLEVAAATDMTGQSEQSTQRTQRTQRTSGGRHR